MIWRIEVRVTRTDSDTTTADAVVKAIGYDAYRKLASAGILILRQAIDLALGQ